MPELPDLTLYHEAIEASLGGLELHAATLEGFKQSVGQQNRTIKRALTDQHYLRGIGNAYSDEILHRARLNPNAPNSTGQKTLRNWISSACGE